MSLSTGLLESLPVEVVSRRVRDPKEQGSHDASQLSPIRGEHQEGAMTGASQRLAATGHLEALWVSVPSHRLPSI